MSILCHQKSLILHSRRFAAINFLKLLSYNQKKNKTKNKKQKQKTLICKAPYASLGFPSGSVSKESACNLEDLVRFLGWEDPLEEDKATHSSILAWRIPMDTGAWWPAVGGKESDATEQISAAQHMHH